jgi:hypothetical protein
METSGAAVPPLPSPEAAEEIQALAEAAEARAMEHAELQTPHLGATDDADPTGATEYTDHTDRTGATEYTDATDPTGATEYTEDTEHTGATEYADNADATDRTDATEYTDDTNRFSLEREDRGTENREAQNGELPNRELQNRELANGEPEPSNREREPENREREPENREREPENREPEPENREPEPANREPEPENREPENREPDAAAARLGADGVARLLAGYLDIVGRHDEKPLDEADRAELKASAERLNPDTWRTADEVALALEQYETVFESLRAVVGRHPRRRV